MEIGWSKKVKRSLRASHLMEPKTKIGKLRALLPEMEIILAGGQRQNDCVEFLKKHGLAYESLNHFRVDLYRARKLGSLSGPGRPAIASPGEGRRPLAEPVIEPRSAASPKALAMELAGKAETRTGGEITTVENVDGVLRVSIKKKTPVLNTRPRLSDFL